MKRQTLSLCIPAYNAADSLPRLLRSVAAQTVAFDEVLLYDDCSSDATAAIAREFGALVVPSSVNRGPSVGKNLLVGVTACDWAHFHDSDDELHPQFVERAQEWLGCDDVDAVLFGMEDREEGSGRTLARRLWDDEALSADAIRYCILNTVTNCGIYRRAKFVAVGGFDTSAETKYNEDQAMHLRLALRGLRIRADPYVGGIVYRRVGSMSSGHQIECARAQYYVLSTVARQTGRRYSSEIGERLWALAGVSAAYKDWSYVRNCLDLASAIGCDRPTRGSRVFRILAGVHPFGGIALREYLIRLLKRHLRARVPTVSTRI